MSVEQSSSGNGNTPADNMRPGIIRNNRKQKGHQNRNKQQVSGKSLSITQLSTFEGAEKGIGAVLAMPSEDVQACKGFKAFQTALEYFTVQKFDNGRDLTPLIEDIKDPVVYFRNTVPLPNRYTMAECEQDFVKQNYMKDAAKDYFTRERNIESNATTLYSYIWGQCTPAFQAELKALPAFDIHRKKYDTLWLLRESKKLVSSIEANGNKFYNAYTVLQTFEQLRQKSNESEETWLDRFQAAVEVLELANCDHIFYSEDLSGLASTATNVDIENEKLKFQAMYFIMKSDDRKFGDLKLELYRDMNKGSDTYPLTPTEAYNRLLKHLRVPNAPNQSDFGSDNAPRSSVSFLQVRLTDGSQVDVDETKLVAGADGKVIKKPCFSCGHFGHLIYQCPTLSSADRKKAKDEADARKSASIATGSTRTSTSLLQIRRSFVQRDITSNNSTSSPLGSHIIMLDSCSESSVVMNPDLVTDIRTCAPHECIQVVTNGNGSVIFDKMGTLSLLPLAVHVNVDSMANILSLRDVSNIDGVRVTMDSFEERAICVHLPSGLTYVFFEGENGLYFFDTTNPGNHIKNTVTAYSFTSTVSSNKSFFPRQQIQGADSARTLQRVLGWPSDSELKRIVSEHYIMNCKVNQDDIQRADFIYGKPVPLLKGKMTRKPTQFKPHSTIPLPPAISEFHRDVDLFMDFFFVNKVPFLHTKSKNINFLSIQSFQKRTVKNITEGLSTVINAYQSRGLQITSIHGDNEFNITTLKESIRPIMLHIYGRNEHVGVAERSIRTIKEQTRSICHSLPYKYYTKLMTTALLSNVTYWLNAFPHKDGVSKNLSPASIVLGRSPIDYNHSRIAFGSYAMVYTSTNNNMSKRSVEAIALNPSNEKGGYYFMSLETGRKINGYIWEELPISDRAIRRIHELAKKEKQPELVDGCITFEWSPGIPIQDEQIDRPNDIDDTIEDEDVVDDAVDHIQIMDDDNDDASQLCLEQEEDVPHFDEDVEPILENEGAVDNDDTKIDNDDAISVNEGANDDDSSFLQNDNINDESLIDDDTPNEVKVETVDDEQNYQGAQDNDQQINNHDIISDTNSTADTNHELRRTSRKNAGVPPLRLKMALRGKQYKMERQKKQSLQFLMKKHMEKQDVCPDLFNIATKVMFTQMTAKEGIKKFGERAIAALFKEYNQLDKGAREGQPVLAPINPDTLTTTQKRQALYAVNLIKEKRCGKIKGRTCADGSRQKRYLSQDENISSPTASLEGIMTTLAIDAHEKRDVVTVDIPGAFLQSEMPKDKHIHMKFTDDFVDIMCEVNPEYLPHVRYEKGKKVLYVSVIRAIYGCIFSALCWYELFSTTLKDMGFKINPYDRCVANKEINGKQCTVVWYVDDVKISHVDRNVNLDIVKQLEKHFGPLEPCIGNKHVYLGMDIEITDQGTIEVGLIDQIKEAIAAFPEDINREVKSPAGHGLFTVDENDSLLSTTKADTFHSIVAKLLWIMKRSRPDIEPTISFLTTRVANPNFKDWEKLKRCLQFLHNTVNDKRIIGTDSLGMIYTWIDAAYAVHPNMRSHTGGCMSFGLGTVHCRSSKQKLNTKSSTEAEVVGLSEYAPYNIWLVMFLLEQGYSIASNMVYQDNQSAIRMEKNGRNSCTGNSRHIHIRYFFVKDRVDKGEMDIGYCPTECMLADFFTKPLQGALFHRFRDVIMGYKHISTLHSHSSKERVEQLDVQVDERKYSNDEIKNKSITWADVVKSKGTNNKV